MLKLLSAFIRIRGNSRKFAFPYTRKLTPLSRTAIFVPVIRFYTFSVANISSLSE